ncbi:hypothetical protein D3C80_1604300 [compost metagenome]
MLCLAGTFCVAAPFDAVAVRQCQSINLRFNPRQNIARGLLAKRRRVGLNRQHAAAVPTQNERVFPLQRKVAHHVAHRNVLMTVLTPHQHVIQMVGILAFVFWRTDNDGQQIRTFTV